MESDAFGAEQSLGLTGGSKADKKWLELVGGTGLFGIGFHCINRIILGVTIMVGS